MKKKNWLTLMTVGVVACAAVVSIAMKWDHTAEASPESASAANQKVEASSTDNMPVVQYHLARDRAYHTLQELKEDAKFIVIADFLQKDPSRMEGPIVETHNEFLVKKVFKGPKELEGTQITINETGGIYKGKKYLPEDNEELFDEGEYLLFLDKGDKYFVEGGGSGKFKLNTLADRKGKFDLSANYLDTKLKAYGIDKVRHEVENLSGKQLLNKLQ